MANCIDFLVVSADTSVARLGNSGDLRPRSVRLLTTSETITAALEPDLRSTICRPITKAIPNHIADESEKKTDRAVYRVGSEALVPTVIVKRKSARFINPVEKKSLACIVSFHGCWKAFLRAIGGAMQ